MKRIEITVAPTGETKVESFGFVGNDCRAATAAIESAIGLATSESLKPEYHLAREPNEQRARNG